MLKKFALLFGLFAALFAGDNALLGTQNLLLIQLGAIYTIAAGTLNFLFEKH